MKLAPKISLKVLFGFTTLAAFAVYFVPIKYSATCDYLGQGRYISTIMNDTVDIQGRNLTQSFENGSQCIFDKCKTSFESSMRRLGHRIQNQPIQLRQTETV